jgi:hypothetical protein
VRVGSILILIVDGGDGDVDGNSYSQWKIFYEVGRV